jgi:hypothetical protein
LGFINTQHPKSPSKVAGPFDRRIVKHEQPPFQQALQLSDSRTREKMQDEMTQTLPVLVRLVALEMGTGAEGRCSPSNT